MKDAEIDKGNSRLIPGASRGDGNVQLSNIQYPLSNMQYAISNDGGKILSIGCWLLDIGYLHIEQKIFAH